MRPCGSHASFPLLSFPHAEHSQLGHHIPLLPFHVVFVFLSVLCFFKITLHVHILILVLRNFLEPNKEAFYIANGFRYSWLFYRSQLITNTEITLFWLPMNQINTSQQIRPPKLSQSRISRPHIKPMVSHQLQSSTRFDTNKLQVPKNAVLVT